MLLLSIFIHSFPSTLFSFKTTSFSFWTDSFHVLRTFKLIESSPKPNLVYSYRTFVPQTSLYSITNQVSKIPKYIAYFYSLVHYRMVSERTQ